MTESDLLAIESGLQIELPEEFRSFMLKHGSEIRQAEQKLRYDDVLMTNPKKVVELNLKLRRYGIETGPDATPAPWPLEYLALNDNGAGDHECIKLNDAKGAVYLFNGEEGRFIRKYKSLDDYLGKLGKRVKKFEKSGPGKSDPKLLDALLLFSGNQSFAVVIERVEKPASPEGLVAAGIDSEQLKSKLAKLLEIITGIAAGSWRMTIGAGEYPPQLEVAYSTNANPAGPLALSSIQMMDGEFMIGFKAHDPKASPPNPPVDWLAFENALCALHETVIGKSVRLTLGNMSGEFNEHGYGNYKGKYCLAVK
jgi:hypothetical protein